MDAYTPMPVEGLAEAIGFRSNWVQRLVFVGGLCGATGGFMLCWWITVIAYPHNRRRTAAEFLARLRSDHVRMHGADRLHHRRGRDAGAERAAAALSSGLQRRSASRAPPETDFSCASKPRIRSSMSTPRAQFLEQPESAGGDGCCAVSISCFCVMRCWRLAGCRQDMHDQPRYKPLAALTSSATAAPRGPSVEGTVARGHLRIDGARYTGKVDGKDVD